MEELDFNDDYYEDETEDELFGWHVVTIEDFDYDTIIDNPVLEV